MIEPNIPTAADIKEELAKLEARPASVVLIAIEQPEGLRFHPDNVGLAKLEERKAPKTGLERTRRNRAASAQKVA